MQGLTTTTTTATASGSLEIVAESDSRDAVAAAAIGANAVNAARDLQNQPSNVATPTYLADRAAAIAAEVGNIEFEHPRPRMDREQGHGRLRRRRQGLAPKSRA